MNQTYVITRLNDWSNDKIRREDSGIGWPRKLPGYDGMPIGGGNTAYAPNISEECYETDKCVCALHVVDEVLFDVVMLTYVFSTVTAEQRLKRLGWKDKSTYHRYLHKAHSTVYEFMLDLSAGFVLPQPKLTLASVNIPANTLKVSETTNANFYRGLTRTFTGG
jgi:hypothetical protein